MRALLLGVVAILALGVSSSASIVMVGHTDDDFGEAPLTRLRYLAAPGQRNSITIRPSGRNRLVIDSGASVGVAGQCAAIDTLLGGPGDDLIGFATRPARLGCGAGRDRLALKTLHGMDRRGTHGGTRERAEFGGLSIAVDPRRVGGRVRIRRHL